MELWNHQKEAIARARQEENLAIFHDPGLGKTRTMIEIYLEKMDFYKRSLRCLIFTPKSVTGSWAKEFIKYTEISSHKITVLGGGSNRKRLLLFKEKVAINEGQIFIVNYEALLDEDLRKAFVEWAPEILACDESHRLKSHDSKRSKYMEAIAAKALHRYLLTGTPILKDEADIFQQYKILDGGVTFGPKFFVFQRLYFEDANSAWQHQQNHFPKYVPRKGSHEKLKSLIYSKAVRATADKCLDLPPLIRREVEVDLSPMQKRAYAEMKADFITFVRDNQDKPRAVVAELAMHKALRLQQIVSGFVKVDRTETRPEENIRFKDVPRLDVLEELIEDISPSQKIIVWACFIENYGMIEDILKRLKIDYAKVVGGTKEPQREIDRFQLDPKCRVMVSNQKAGGTGLNLQQASTAIYFSKWYSYDEDYQSLRRCYRGGSEIHQVITRIDLVAPKTIDVIVNEAIAQKQEISDLLLNINDLILKL